MKQSINHEMVAAIREFHLAEQDFEQAAPLFVDAATYYLLASIEKVNALRRELRKGMQMEGGDESKWSYIVTISKITNDTIYQKHN